MEIVFASQNLHKIREVREMLKAIQGLDVLTLLDFPDYTPPAEDGNEFSENAEIKAVRASKALNRLVLADDSGLVVPVLEGKPGVRSKRYAGEEATDKDNRAKLLKALEEKTGIARTGYFECCLVVADPEGVLKTVTGRCEGEISKEERGNHGFGYDSIFIKHDYDKTFGELDDNVKNRVSHRRKAIEAIMPFIEQLQSKESLKS